MIKIFGAKKRARYLTIALGVIAGTFLSLTALATQEHWADDTPYFANYRKVQVYLDWQSFIDQGIPADQVEPFSNLARSAIKRWNEIGGAKLQILWRGRRDKQPNPKNGSELVLRMEPCVYFPNDEQKSAVATGYGVRNGGANVTFYKNLASDTQGCAVGTRINWHFGWTNEAGGRGAQYVLVHELGHALGLKKHTPTTVTRYSALSTDGNAVWPQRFGPWEDDINRLQALYGTRIGTSQVHIKKSTDYGYSWNVLEALDKDKFLTSTQPIGFTKTGSNFVAAYTLPIWGFLKTIYGNERDGFKDGSVLWFSSARGVSLSANGNTSMLAFVDRLGDTVEGGEMFNYQIRLRRSTDLGKNWAKVNLPPSYSAETPTLKFIGNNTWVLAYSLFGNSEQTKGPPPRIPPFPFPFPAFAPTADSTSEYINYVSQFGRLIVRVSSDNGNTWSSELTPNNEGKWSYLLGPNNQFASDPGWRVTSEIGVESLNGILVLQMSTMKTEPRFNTQNFKLGFVTGSSTALAGTEELYGVNGPVLAMGSNVLMQAFNIDNKVKTRVSAWGGSTGPLRFASASDQLPALEVDPYYNHFYMVTTETP